MTRRPVAVTLLMLLGACGGGSTEPATGSLAVAVSGLPDGVSAAVNVTGPGGYQRVVTETETLAGLAAGSYTVAATGVSAGSAAYTPSPTTQGIAVTGGDAANADVVYSTASGALAITIGGLPGGTSAAVTVSGPAGYTHQATSSQTLTGLAAGQYTLTAQPVTDGTDQYSPAPASQVTTVGSGTASATVNYSSGGTAGFNLRVDGLYLVQSVQTYTRGVPLVSGRSALLRVFVTANQVNAAQPTVRVRLYSDGVLASTTTVVAPGLTTPLAADEADIATSWNLVIDKALIQPNLSVLVEVDPDNTIAEGNEADNVFPGNGTPASLEVRNATPFHVVFIPVVTKADNRQGNVTQANRDRYLDLTMRMHPLASFTSAVHTPYTTATNLALQSDNTNNAWNIIVNEILALRQAESDSRYYYGVVSPSYNSGVAGVGYIGAEAAIGWDKLPSGSSVAAHEWGHNWGRQHAPCGGAGNPTRTTRMPAGRSAWWATMSSRGGFIPRALMISWGTATTNGSATTPTTGSWRTGPPSPRSPAWLKRYSPDCWSGAGSSGVGPYWSPLSTSPRGRACPAAPARTTSRAAAPTAAASSRSTSLRSSSRTIRRARSTSRSSCRSGPSAPSAWLRCT